MLLAEEVAAHQQLTSSSGGIGSSVQQALLQLLDAASHQQALLQHAECVLAPALQVMRQMAAQQQLQAQQLQDDNARLKVRGQALLRGRDCQVTGSTYVHTGERCCAGILYAFMQGAPSLPMVQVYSPG